MRSVLRAAAGLLSLGIAVCAADGKQAKKPAAMREESMASDRFAEAHAPLFRPPKSNDAGALTERPASQKPPIAADSLPSAQLHRPAYLRPDAPRHARHAPLRPITNFCAA
jgi:hypothetical protein